MNATPTRSVHSGNVIGLRYIMRNRQGEILEDRMTGEPAFYLQGGSAIMTGLQEQLEGLLPGDSKQVFLKTGEESAEPDFSFDVIIYSVRAASGAELELGYPLPFIIGCGPDCDCYWEPAPVEDSKSENQMT